MDTTTLTPEQQATIRNANNTAINPETLGNVTSPKLPSPTPTPYPMVNYQSIAQNDAKLNQDINAASDKEQNVFDQLFNAREGLATQGSRTASAENAAGIPELNTQLTDINNEIASTSLNYRREREAIARTPGLTQEAAQQRLSDVSRKQAAHLADLETVRAARSANLSNIENALSRRLELQFADEKARVDNLKFVYDAVKGDLTKLEDRKAQQVISREERFLDSEYKKAQMFEDTKAAALERAAADGADNATLLRISQAPDQAAFLKVAGKYAGDYLKTQLMKEQIMTERAQRAKLSGDKALTADEKKVQKANQNVYKLLEDYKNEIRGLNFVSANSPEKRVAINSLRGRITAEYKQAKQLGTLDAGVQKLIDGIIPDPGSFSIGSFDPEAQIKAVEDFQNDFRTGDEPGMTELDSYYQTVRGAYNSAQESNTSLGGWVNGVTGKNTKPN